MQQESIPKGAPECTTDGIRSDKKQNQVYGDPSAELSEIQQPVTEGNCRKRCTDTEPEADLSLKVKTTTGNQSQWHWPKWLRCTHAEASAVQSNATQQESNKMGSANVTTGTDLSQSEHLSKKFNLCKCSCSKEYTKAVFIWWIGLLLRRVKKLSPKRLLSLDLLVQFKRTNCW